MAKNVSYFVYFANGNKLTLCDANNEAQAKTIFENLTKVASCYPGATGYLPKRLVKRTEEEINK